jgi:sugar-specific transcriptional regulator TrmB
MVELDQQLASKIKKVGLSDKEAAVYAALLSTGGAYPSRLAEITRLNRTTIYKVLENLSVRGLVSELEKRNKLFYQVENPRNLERFAQTQISRAKQQFENVESLLPVLQGLYAHADNKPIVRFFEGREGVLKVYEDHVAPQAPYEMVAFSNTADLLKFLPEAFRVSYIKKKQKIGIKTRGVLPDTEIDVDYTKTIYKDFPKETWPKVKHIPHKKFPYQSDVTIYGNNKVSIINFSQPQFAGTIIEDKTIHDMMKMIFELAWAGVDSVTKKLR